MRNSASSVACIHPESVGLAQWPCGHLTCLECAKKLISTSPFCSTCRQPHHGKFTAIISVSDDEFEDERAPKTTPKTRPASSPVSKKYKSSAPTNAAKPARGGRKTLSVQVVELAQEVESLRARNVELSTAAPELDAMKKRLAMREKLCETLEDRVATLELDKQTSRKERDAALAAKDASERREQANGNDRLSAEMRYVRQAKASEERAKSAETKAIRLEHELESARSRGDRLHDLLARHKDKELAYRAEIKELTNQNDTLKRRSSKTFSPPPPSSSLPPSSPEPDAGSDDEKCVILDDDDEPAGPKDAGKFILDRTMFPLKSSSPPRPEVLPPKKKQKISGTLSGWLNSSSPSSRSTLHIGPRRSRNV